MAEEQKSRPQAQWVTALFEIVRDLGYDKGRIDRSGKEARK